MRLQRDKSNSLYSVIGGGFPGCHAWRMAANSRLKLDERPAVIAGFKIEKADGVSASDMKRRRQGETNLRLSHAGTCDPF